MRQRVVLWVTIVDDIFGSILVGSAWVADLDLFGGLALDFVFVARWAFLYTYTIRENIGRVLSSRVDVANVKFGVFAVAWRESTNVFVTVDRRD